MTYFCFYFEICSILHIDGVVWYIEKVIKCCSFCIMSISPLNIDHLSVMNPCIVGEDIIFDLFLRLLSNMFNTSHRIEGVVWYIEKVIKCCYACIMSLSPLNIDHASVMNPCMVGEDIIFDLRSAFTLKYVQYFTLRVLFGTLKKS